MSVHLIDTSAALRAACDALATALRSDNRIALDTEFVGEQSYEPRLMLLQAASADGEIYLIDPLKLDGQLQPFGDLLNSSGALKLLHAGGQDIPILRATFGPLAGPWFDTQVAAAYVGFPLQTGYTRLVDALLGARLARDESLSNWARRPIPESMLAYAADDVRYLHAAHTRLTERLRKMGRDRWVDEACEEMAQALSEPGAPEDQWRKLARGSGLDGRGLAVLRALCVWRDDEASRRDRPRRSVMRDEALLELSRRAPRTVQAARNLRSLPPSLGERQVGEMVEAIDAALALPPEARPQMDTRSVQLDDQGAALNELLAAVVRVRAIELDIAPTLLASAETVRRISASARVEDVAGALRGWRDGLIGDDLRAALTGSLAVAWDPDAGRMTCRRG